MFLFDSENYKIYLYDLNGDFKATFDLDLEFSYYPYMQFYEKVKVKFSPSIPADYVE